MATINPDGTLQPEVGDLLPREVAHRTDDSADVTALIEKLNPTIETAEDLADAVEQVDTLRRELASRANADNPHIADHDTASVPAPSKLGKHNYKSPTES